MARSGPQVWWFILVCQCHLLLKPPALESLHTGPPTFCPVQADLAKVRGLGSAAFFTRTRAGFGARQGQFLVNPIPRW